jgi:hypothetical protein
MKIKNVTVERGSPHAEYALMWEGGGARYHVWLSDNLHPTGKVGLLGVVLFKNCPLPLKRGNPGYFETRRLKLSIAKNKAMFETALAEAKRDGLFAKADDELATKEQERRAKAAAEYKVTLAEQAGPKMLVVLQAIAQFWSGEQTNAPLSPGALILDDEETIADAVRRVIAEGEGREVT